MNIVIRSKRENAYQWEVTEIRARICCPTNFPDYCVEIITEESSRYGKPKTSALYITKSEATTLGAKLIELGKSP